MSPEERDPEVVEVAVEVPAPPAEVFGYFTDPGLLVSWMGRSAQLRPRLAAATTSR